MDALKFPPVDLSSLRERILRLRGDPARPPRLSIVVPVNARSDLSNVLNLVSDVAWYQGQQTAEIILVVNNFPPEHPPFEIEQYRGYGMEVLAIPKIVAVGGIAIAARIPGVQQAQSEWVISFDADCRIPDSAALLEWYALQFEKGVDLAYTHVDYYDLPPGFSVQVRMFIHHASRWFRRVVLRMPTSRGSNYGVRRRRMLDLYQQGKIPYDFHVGPVMKAIGGRLAYSGARELTVYTSGRFFSGGWKELLDYLFWRLGYYYRIWRQRRRTTSAPEQE